MERRHDHRRFTNEIDDLKDRRSRRNIESQKRFNSFIGLLALALFLFFALDIGGWATDLGAFLMGK